MRKLSSGFKEPRRPPTWLDPQKLGVKKLRFVNPKKVEVIQGGRGGLAKFLQHLHKVPKLPLRPEAFVVVSRDKTRQYVFSREQFWLAAYGFLDSDTRDILDEELEDCSQLLKLLPKLQDILKAEDTAREAVVAQVFYIDDDTSAEKITLPDKPAGAALIIDEAGALTRVYVPDTRRINLAPINAGNIYTDLGCPGPDLELWAKELAVRRRDTKQDKIYDRISASISGPVSGQVSVGKHVLQPGSVHGGVTRTGSVHDDVERTEGKDIKQTSGEVERRIQMVRSGVDEKIIRRTPHMEISRPGPFTTGDEFNASVFVDQHAAREGEEAIDLEIPAEKGINDYEISVWLIGTRHFQISRPTLRTFVIHRGIARSDPVVFKVVVRDATVRAIPRVMALFRYNERACGEVSRKIDLSGLSTAEDKPPPALFSVHTTAEPAHLTIEITNPSKDLQHFDCLVSTSLLGDYKFGRTEAWNLNERTEKLVEQYFQEFTARGTTPAARIAALRGAGRKLFDRAPQIFRDAYWRIVDEKKPLQTISILSQDPFIPWELMIPHRGLPDGTFDIRKPLGVEFRMGRWTKKEHFAAAQSVPLNDGWVFAPNYRDPPPPQPLKCADDEAKLVVDDFHGERISPAITAKFIQTIKNDCRSLLHFICHGSSRLAGSQTILDEDKAVLTSLQLAGYEIDNACAKKKPFVFLNACEVGRPIPSLTGLGGFANEFVNLGASVVIAPLWSVKDDIAHEVAQEFYGAIKADPRTPFAEVIRKIRKKAYDDPAGEDTYAAYCFYGDPLAAKTLSYSDRKFTCPHPQCSKIMILTPEEYAEKRYCCPYCRASGII
jgi:CHAT domain-containing protein